MSRTYKDRLSKKTIRFVLEVFKNHDGTYEVFWKDELVRSRVQERWLNERQVAIAGRKSVGRHTDFLPLKLQELKYCRTLNKGPKTHCRLDSPLVMAASVAVPFNWNKIVEKIGKRLRAEYRTQFGKKMQCDLTLN